jgi:hypothetical protein
MSGLPIADVEHGTRTPFAIDGEREVRCLLKSGQVIAAIRCVEAQKEGCFCPAAFGALQGLEALSADPNRASATLHETDVATRAKWRIDLVQLKARAAGFVGKKQEFAGPALSHMNRELQRKVEQRQVLDRAPVPQKPIVVSQLSADAADARRARIAEAVEARQEEKANVSHKGPGASGNRVAREEGVATAVAGETPGRAVVATDARPGAVSADKPAVSAPVTAGASRREDRSGEPDGRRGSAEGGPPTPAAAAKRICVGLPGKPCTTPLRVCAGGVRLDRCSRCRAAAEHEAYPTCPKCQRKSKDIPGTDGICRRCLSSGRQARGNGSPPPASSFEVTKEEVPPTNLHAAVESWRAQGVELRKLLEAEQWQLLGRLDEVKKVLATLPK